MAQLSRSGRAAQLCCELHSCAAREQKEQKALCCERRDPITAAPMCKYNWRRQVRGPAGAPAEDVSGRHLVVFVPDEMEVWAGEEFDSLLVGDGPLAARIALLPKEMAREIVEFAHGDAPREV